MAAKKIKCQEEDISEILVAYADTESGAEDSNVKDELEEQEEEEQQKNSKPQQKTNHRLQQVVDYQTGDHLKEGTQIFILLSVHPKV